MGAGLDVLVGPGKLTLDGRYTIGVTNVMEGPDAKNGVISLMLGYGF